MPCGSLEEEHTNQYMNAELVANSRESEGIVPNCEWAHTDSERDDEDEAFEQPTRSAPAMRGAPPSTTAIENRYQALELSPVTETGKMSGKGLRLPSPTTPEVGTAVRPQ